MSLPFEEARRNFEEARRKLNADMGAAETLRRLELELQQRGPVFDRSRWPNFDQWRSHSAVSSRKTELLHEQTLTIDDACLATDIASIDAACAQKEARTQPAAQQFKCDEDLEEQVAAIDHACHLTDVTDAFMRLAFEESAPSCLLSRSVEQTRCF